MATATASVAISRSAAEVFAYVSQAANNPDWHAHVVETVWLDDGPMGPGRRGRQTSKVLGRRYEVIAEIVDWEPPRHVSWATMVGGADVRTECTVDPSGHGCVVTLTTAGQFTGGLLRLLSPVAIALMRRQTQSDMARLKAILEEGVVTGST